MTNQVTLKLVDTPADAPTYGSETRLLRLHTCIVVGKGTEAGNPTIDLQLIDEDGREYIAMVTGGILEGIAAAVQGKKAAGMH